MGPSILRLFNEFDYPGEGRLGADPRCPEGEAPGPFIVAAKTSISASLATGMLSPVSIDSSIVEFPETTTPSVGIFSPGRTMIRSPLRTPSIGDVLLDAVPDDAGRLGLQPYQSLDGLRGASFGLRLEEASEDDQGHDEGRPVIVDVGGDLRPCEELRKKVARAE